MLDIVGFSVSAKTGILIVHLVGLAIGIGAATVLDLLIVRCLIKRHVSQELAGLVESATVVVAVGLSLVWLSGIGFLLNYYFYNPVGLANPKVWAKVSIVAVLTLNGVFVHKAILPLIKRNVGRALFDGVSPAMKGVFLASGAVSATSWYVPLVLGALPEINFVVSVQTILAIYAGILSVAIACTVAGGRFFARSEIRDPSLQAEAPTPA
jgi:hypothetical protein